LNFFICACFLILVIDGIFLLKDFCKKPFRTEIKKSHNINQKLFVYIGLLILDFLVMEEYISIEQLSQLLGIKKSTAYKISSNKILPKYCLGGKNILFKASDAVKYIESKRIASREETKQALLKKIFNS
jgi:excisionase family DNA binding protein